MIEGQNTSTVRSVTTEDISFEKEQSLPNFSCTVTTIQHPDEHSSQKIHEEV